MSGLRKLPGVVIFQRDACHSRLIKSDVIPHMVIDKIARLDTYISQIYLATRDIHVNNLCDTIDYVEISWINEKKSESVDINSTQPSFQRSLKNKANVREAAYANSTMMGSAERALPRENLVRDFLVGRVHTVAKTFRTRWMHDDVATAA